MPSSSRSSSKGIDPDVRVRADAERDRPRADPLRREEAVAEVGLGGRARADGGACGGQEVELGAVRVRRMDDRRPFAEAARALEQLDRAAAVLGDALLDLPRLLVGVDVERESLGLGVARDRLEPVRRARAHGVGATPTYSPALRSSSTSTRYSDTDPCRKRGSPPRA